MSNAIATVSVKLIADTTGFTTGIVRKDLKEIDQILRDSSPQLDSHARKVKVLDSLYKDNTIGVDEYKKALAGLNDKLAATKSPGGIAAPSAADPTGGLGSLASQKAGNLPIVGDLMNAAGVAGPAGIAVAGAFAAMAAGAAVATIATKELIGITLSAIDRLDAIGDSAQALGIEASSLQRLTIAADLADAPVEQLSDALGKMESILGDPSEEMLKTFGRLNLDAEKLKNMKADQAFEAIAASIGKLGTRAEQISAVSDIFGRGNKELVNLIDSFDRVNAIAEKFTLSEEQFAAVGEADLAMKELNHTIEGVANTLGAELAPAVADISQAFADFLQSDPAQSTLFRGITLLKNVVEDSVAAAKAAAAPSEEGKAASPFGRLLAPQAALVSEFLINPYIKSSNEGAELEKKKREMDKARKGAKEETDAAAEVASGSMTEQEFNAWLKGWKEQEKAADDFAKKLQHVADEASAYGNTQDEMRLKAMDAGAASEDQINSYVEQLKKLDDAKNLRKEQDETQKEFEKSLDERDRKREKFVEEGLTKKEKAEKEIRDAQAAGVTGQDMDKLRNKLAKDIAPKTIDQAATGAAKGSQEAYAAIARAGRATAQELLLKEIRDSLRRQEKKDVIVLTEVVA